MGNYISGGKLPAYAANRHDRREIGAYSCPRCEKRFTSKRGPRVLGCGHSVCSACVGKALGFGRMFATCAICGKRSRKPFIENITLKEIIIDQENGIGIEYAKRQSSRPTFTNEKFAEILKLPQQRRVTNEMTPAHRIKSGPVRSEPTHPIIHHRSDHSPPRARSNTPTRHHEHVHFKQNNDGDSPTPKPRNSTSEFIFRSKSEPHVVGTPPKRESSSPRTSSSSPRRPSPGTSHQRRSSMSQPRNSISHPLPLDNVRTFTEARDITSFNKYQQREKLSPNSSPEQKPGPYGEGADLLKLLELDEYSGEIHEHIHKGDTDFFFDLTIADLSHTHLSDGYFLHKLKWTVPMINKLRTALDNIIDGPHSYPPRETLQKSEIHPIEPISPLPKIVGRTMLAPPLDTDTTSISLTAQGKSSSHLPSRSFGQSSSDPISGGQANNTHRASRTSQGDVPMSYGQSRHSRTSKSLEPPEVGVHSRELRNSMNKIPTRGSHVTTGTRPSQLLNSSDIIPPRAPSRKPSAKNVDSPEVSPLSTSTGRLRKKTKSPITSSSRYK